jgi:hypothetical protein
MVHEHDPAANRPDRQAVIAALLGFIEKTTATAGAYDAAGKQAALLNRGEPFALRFRQTSLGDAIMAGANTVNDYLAEAGGIPAAWTDKKNGEYMQGVILGCKEFNPETGCWNLVFQRPTHTELIGATPQRLAEILGHDQTQPGPDPLG